MAQLVERRVRNAKVRGPNPLISTTKLKSNIRFGLSFFYCNALAAPRARYSNFTTASTVSIHAEITFVCAITILFAKICPSHTLR